MRSPVTPSVLISEVIATLKQEIVPSCDANHKYSLLMCINALEISLRSIDTEVVDTEDKVSQLIADIRSGTHDDLKALGSQSLLEALGKENAKELSISVPPKKYQTLIAEK